MRFRFVRHNLLYAVTVVLLLGVGTGASAIIFTALDAFLLRPLPVVRPERLARLGVEASATHVTFDHSSVYASVLGQHGRSFDSVLTFLPLHAALTASNQVETVTCEVISENYFHGLGLRPEAGVFFDRGAGGSLPAVISHTIWQSVFRGRKDVIGSGIRVRGAAFTVVGIAPVGFGGLDLETRTDVWVPVNAWRAWTGNADLRRQPAQIVVRLREGVRLAQAEAEARVLYPAMVDADLNIEPAGVTEADVAQQKGRRVILVSAEHGISAMRKQLWAATPALLGAIAALLVLVMANVGGLMLVRAEARRPDIALRISLGASRWGIVRAALSESLMLAGGGALLGYVIAQYWGPRLMAFLPSRRPLNVDLHPDLRVLAFTILITAGVSLLASIAPALAAARTGLIQTLGKGGRRASAPASARRIVTIQIALATILVAGSITLVRSLEALRDQNPGFNRERLIVAVLDPSMAGVSAKQLPTLYDEILRRARQLPGVAGASLAGFPLMRGVGYKNTMGPAGARLTPADRLNVSLNYASETHLKNLGIKLVAGRTVSRADLDIHPTPVVATEALARAFFPGTDALGRDFGPAGPNGLARAQFRVVGLTRDVKYRGMRELAPPTFFAALSGSEELVTLHVRTRVDEAAVMGRVRAMLATVGSGLAPVDMATMDQEIETSLWQERMLSFLSEVFGALAVIIAATGSFGLIAFMLARRTREVGIRAAIGATPMRIAGLFARSSIMAVGPGILIGGGIFVAVRSALSPLLFGWGTGVAVPLIASATVMALTTIVAVAMPVLRATQIESTVALREE